MVLLGDFGGIEDYDHWKGRGGHTPEDRQVLAELDDLLQHERGDVHRVHEQQQHGGQAGRAPVTGKQVLWGLLRPALSCQPRSGRHCAGDREGGQ